MVKTKSNLSNVKYKKIECFTKIFVFIIRV